MNAYDAMITRRSTRSYKSNMVELEKLQRIIEAGRYAPSGGNNQTNHFLVITDPEVIRKLVTMAEASFARMETTEDMYSSLRTSVTLSKRGGYVFSYNAPVLIAVANKMDYGNNIADSVMAIENMMIAANELDLGSCFINQLNWLNEDADINAYLMELGMKEDERIYGSMVVGYPATDNGLPVRKPLERKGNEVTYVGK